MAAVDGVLEATVVGSFTSIGPVVRARTAGWTPPPSLAGRTVLVTGGTSGLGLAAACGVARLGARVVLTARDHDRAEQACRHRATDRTGGRRLVPPRRHGRVRPGAGPRRGVPGRKRPARRPDPQRGALTKRYRATGSGLELTVAVQVAAPYLLTGLLLPALRAAAPSRVVQVSSGGMYTQRFDLGSVEMGPTDYDGTVAYARSKRAQLVLMHEWVRRTPGTGVRFHAMHPGWADTPGIHESLPGFSRVVGPLLRSPEQGADTAVWLAAAPAGVETTGGFWLDRRRRWEHRVPWTRLSEQEFHDAGAALWAWCAERTGWDGPTRPV